MTQIAKFLSFFTVGSGECVPCQCSNNTNTCNELDGTCINCRYNTTGVNCEQCAVGWYGNATQQNCKGNNFS